MKLRLVMVLMGVVLAMPAGMRAQDGEGKADVDALYTRAEALMKASKMQEATKVYEKVVEKAKKVFGPNHVNTAALMNNLAGLYQVMGQHAKALPLFQRSLEIREANLGKEHPDVATSLNNLAKLYHEMGEHGKALPLYQRSLEIREARLGKDHPTVSISLNNLAVLYNDMRKHAKALPLFQRSLKIMEAKLGKDHPDVAYSLNGLAMLYQDMGEHGKALPLYKRSLEIRKVKLSKDHPEVATSLNNLGLLYQVMGQYGKGLPLYQRSLEIREARLGKDHPAVATALNNLAALYHEMGEHGKALPLFQRSLEIREAKLGKDHPDVAGILNNLAGAYRDIGQYAKALSHYQRSLEIKEATFGKDHPDVALSLGNLASLYESMRQHGKALQLYQRSLEIREATFGKDHPDVAYTLNNLAILYVGRDEVPKATRLFDRARRGARRHIASVLPALSDAEKAAFFLNTGARRVLEAALSLGLAHKNDGILSGQSATWLLNGKAIDQESLASSALLARQSNDPSLGKLAGRLLTLRQQLARLTLAAPRPGQEKQRLQQIEVLTTQEQDLARQLRQASSKAVAAPWIDLADVRKSLPADAVLIDVAHFDVYDFKGKARRNWQAARYAAWVTAKTGPVRLVDLGPAGKIDEAVKQFREAMQGASKRIKVEGEEKAEKTLRDHLDALSKLVLTPLLPLIGTSKRILLSPDGNLWLVPWEALTLSDGKYAIEKYRIDYLTSGRDLLPAPTPKVTVGAPLVLADPDFDLEPEKARGEAKRLGAGEDEEGTRSLSGVMRLGLVKALPGTASEAKVILPSLKGYAGVTPRIFTREQALEGVFKSAKSPRVLVLCTHGFFLPDQEVPRDEDGKPKATRKWENPLLRCGLLLAGCNKASKIEGVDDGILTGLEVVGTDLRGTELVVLSACDTGLGEVQSGEGVSGLRQAFQLAGAKAVVSTLWQVPDKQSARLMALFFQNLSKDMSKSEALRAAKMKIIEERRDDFAAAHPFFWAAFTLTGEP